ncbi:MAG: methylmalonyl Co-A mutase-associated GTPase MeaB [Saprospiraceae bacterium]|nr:methylmalonyl Co-A mutase-associated GTPase MeaB [Saprospiraceae bacterium]
MSATPTGFFNPQKTQLMPQPSKYDSINMWAKRIRSGDRAALSRAITLVESRLESDQVLANKLLSRCKPIGGKTVRLGITGPPGAGKSSFIEFFGNEWIKLNGSKIAVLTVDPSSPDMGGSILGDKTRMQSLAQQTGVFIRPSPSNQHPGGVHAQTRRSIQLCEYAGYENIWIETIGVGQSELTVRDITDLTLLILPPAGGDELQGIKKGITEIADLLIVNKNDSGLEDQVAYTQSQYQGAIYLRSGKPIKVLKCSSLLKTGFGPIRDQVVNLIEERRKNGQWKKNRIQQQASWFDSMIRQQWLAQLNDCQELISLKKIKKLALKQNTDMNKLLHQYLHLLKKYALQAR